MEKKRESQWRDAVAAHASFDQPLPLLLAGAAFLWGGAVAHHPDFTTVLEGVSTLAGLMLAAATFVCTMTYQAQGAHMKVVRARYAEELRGNWAAIITSSLVAALLPLVAMLLSDSHEGLAVALAAYSVAILVARFRRAMFWLRYALFMEQASAGVAPNWDVIPPPVRNRRDLSKH